MLKSPVSLCLCSFEFLKELRHPETLASLPADIGHRIAMGLYLVKLRGLRFRISWMLFFVTEFPEFGWTSTPKPSA